MTRESKFDDRRHSMVVIYNGLNKDYDFKESRTQQEGTGDG